MKQFLGLEEVAKILGMKKQNVQMHIRSNTFPPTAVFIGSRSGWAFEQIEDYAKRKGMTINLDTLKDKDLTIQEMESTDVPPYYYLGGTEVANLLGWLPAKVKVYSDRDMLPRPVVQIGTRIAWSFSQIQKYANQNGITLVDLPNENLAEIVLDIEKNEVWTVVPTYTGKWLTKKEAHMSKEMPRKIKGETKTAVRSYKVENEVKLFTKRGEAVQYLLSEAIRVNFEHGVQPDFEKELEKMGGLVDVAFRFTGYKVLPKEKVEVLMNMWVHVEDCKRLALETVVKDELHGVCAFDLKKGTLVSYGIAHDVYPPLQAVIVLYWIDKATGEAHDWTGKIKEQVNKFYK